MAAVMLDGVAAAATVLDEVEARAAAVTRRRGRPPGLATILVGDDAPSAGYVRKKHEACAARGLHSVQIHLPASATEAEVLAAVDDCNTRPGLDAFLVQLPLPAGMDEAAVLFRIAPERDGDGLHPVNLGRLVMNVPAPVACTPAGIVELLRAYDVPVSGREVVIVGRGLTIGRPLALLLSAKSAGANAAVTVVHTGVADIGHLTRRADVIISATGVGESITPDMVRPGAAVVSAGITWAGKRLIPDVREDVGEVAGWITPRLGGVGPMTVALLLRNAVAAAERSGP
jgi:methylenetetrahydrofolate dehydrogenase (NADP+) / methenyltetrahydrofolate cyclohydrolase